jgi:hypothetical protein
MTNITLNDRADGPHAYSNAQAVTEWNNTKWLVDYVEDNNEANDGQWADWSDAELIRTVYTDDRNGSETYCENVKIGERGAAILNAAIAGEDPETLMKKWSEDIQG